MCMCSSCHIYSFGKAGISHRNQQPMNLLHMPAGMLSEQKLIVKNSVDYGWVNGRLEGVSRLVSGRNILIQRYLKVTLSQCYQHQNTSIKRFPVCWILPLWCHLLAPISGHSSDVGISVWKECSGGTRYPTHSEVSVMHCSHFTKG